MLEAAAGGSADAGCSPTIQNRVDVAGGAINVTETPLLDGFGRLANCPGNATHQRSFRLWRDTKLIAEVAFRFPNKPEASNFASELAKAMQRQGPLDILSPPSRRVWQPAAVLAVLNALTPRNALFLLQVSVVLHRTHPRFVQVLILNLH
jgi:hypothetical protein